MPSKKVVDFASTAKVRPVKYKTAASCQDCSEIRYRSVPTSPDDIPISSMADTRTSFMSAPPGIFSCSVKFCTTGSVASRSVSIPPSHTTSGSQTRSRFKRTDCRGKPARYARITVAAACLTIMSGLSGGIGASSLASSSVACRTTAGRACNWRRTLTSKLGNHVKPLVAVSSPTLHMQHTNDKMLALHKRCCVRLSKTTMALPGQQPL
mmetsp:Transcript_195/g.518  ORF Transcript_195/g.518 Transcript_195/m.518 type:complete len:209 (-) Transcript_195:13-639(-)